MNLLKKAGLGIALGATVLTAAAPAEAQRYRRHYYRDRDNGGAAIAAGVVGLALGAAIASSGRDRYRDRYYDRYYDGGYYDQGYYPRRGYYADPYVNPYRGYYQQRCYTQRQWDPYLDRPVRVRYCR